MGRLNELNGSEESKNLDSFRRTRIKGAGKSNQLNGSKGSNETDGLNGCDGLKGSDELGRLKRSNELDGLNGIKALSGPAALRRGASVGGVEGCCVVADKGNSSATPGAVNHYLHRRGTLSPLPCLLLRSWYSIPFRTAATLLRKNQLEIGVVGYFWHYCSIRALTQMLSFWSTLRYYQ